MKKIVISTIISIFFRLCIVFLIAFVWARYFLKSISLSIIVSGAITLGIEILIQFFNSQKRNKQNLKLNEKSKIEGIVSTFIFSEDKTVLDFFYKLASSRHFVQRKAKYLIIEHPNSKILLYPFFTFREFDSDDLIYVYNEGKKVEATKLVICVSKFSNVAEKLAEKLSIKTIILDKTQVYIRLMKEYNIFPDITAKFLAETKYSYIDMLSFSLGRQRTKGYLFSSLVLFLSSFVVRFNLYFVIMSSILMLLALVSFFSPHFHKKVEQGVLD